MQSKKGTVINMNLANNIYTHRTSHNWSQTELADLLGVSRQSVSKWENGAATPDLDKLVKMRELFDVSLDSLVFGSLEGCGEPSQGSNGDTVRLPSLKMRIVSGMIMLIFGLVFFLLSIFFGDHLYFGEVFGELLSSVIVLLSISVIFTYDFRVLAICAVTVFIYSIICFGFLDISNIANYVFTFIASVIVTVWFIICGEHANKECVFKSTYSQEITASAAEITEQIER